MVDDRMCQATLAPLFVIQRIERFPRVLPAAFVLEIMRRIRDGEYDSWRGVDELSRKLLRTGDI